MNVCPTCSYPYKGEGCDNPACPDNPALSDERRASLIEAHRRTAAERLEREALNRARAMSFERGAERP